jgi:hypothetical protein
MGARLNEATSQVFALLMPSICEDAMKWLLQNVFAGE